MKLWGLKLTNLGHFFAKCIFYIYDEAVKKIKSIVFGFYPLRGGVFGQNVRIKVQHFISNIFHYNEISLLLSSTAMKVW